MPTPNRLDIVVAGASAGGLDPLRTLVSGFPPDLDAAIFVVQHTSPRRQSLLAEILDRAGALPAEVAQDGAFFETGKIYVAPSDRHIVFHDGRLRVVRGPRENLHRPSIDVLFRSAATAYRNRVIGVLFSGADDDGAAGMLSIKRDGGVTIVQDPDDAVYPDMPESAIRIGDPDFVLPAVQITPTLVGLVTGKTPRPQKTEGPDPANKSFGQEEGNPINVAWMGTPSAFSCPDCGGTLWELEEGNLLRYQCRVGHAYAMENMYRAESEAIERALWSAVRVLEESAALSRRIGQKTEILRERMQEKALEREEHARVIRNLLLQTSGEALT